MKIMNKVNKKKEAAKKLNNASFTPRSLKSNLTLNALKQVKEDNKFKDGENRIIKITNKSNEKSKK